MKEPILNAYNEETQTPEEFFKKPVMTALERKLEAASEIADILYKYQVDIIVRDGDPIIATLGETV